MKVLVGMGTLVRRPSSQPNGPNQPAPCPRCGCKWGYIDAEVDAIKCGNCDRELK